MVTTNQQKPGARPVKSGAQVAPSATPAPDPKATAKNSWGGLRAFLEDEIDYSTLQVDESEMYPKHKRALRLVHRQLFVIICLTIGIIVLSPFLKPIYRHEAVSPAPNKQYQGLIALTEPNLTDQAVLSWVATSITEILTFGFGDFDRRIRAQKNRFTAEGWESFLNVLRKNNMREDFKLRQLVLTTVPADAPVVVAKGTDIDNDNIWTVEMPIIMTYTTNNNVKVGKRSIVRLTIARVPSAENISGIGIKSWMMLGS